MTENPAPKIIRARGSRRVSTAPVPGTDPRPQEGREAVRAAEDTDSGWGAAAGGPRGPAGPGGTENEAQLRADVPPHWGTHSH